MLNKTISRFGNGNTVLYLDFGDKFLDPDGTIKDKMIYVTYPTGKGYKIWEESVSPIIGQFFPEAKTANVPVAASVPAITPVSPVLGGGTVR